VTNIEQKALALACEVSPDDKNRVCKEPTVYFALWEALCRAIERHEAFRQEVSDALEKRGFYIDDRDLGRFIIAKPDPLVDAMEELGWYNAPTDADDLRAALAKRGGRIVFDD